MFISTLFLLALVVFAYAYPQDAAADNDALKNLDVNALTNRIEFISNFHHAPVSGAKEGDIISITFDPPTPENAAKAKELVKSFTIAIATGEGMIVKEPFFMESERFVGIPTKSMKYDFQLPALMENKDYCIVYTPYASVDGYDKPMIDGVPMESLYEIWFPIKGTAKPGFAAETAQNTIVNDVTIDSVASDNGAAGAPSANNVNAQVQGQAADATTDPNASDAAADRNAPDSDSNIGNAESGGFTISPAITAFIAVLFACFFI